MIQSMKCFHIFRKFFISDLVIIWHLLLLPISNVKGACTGSVDSSALILGFQQQHGAPKTSIFELIFLIKKKLIFSINCSSINDHLGFIWFDMHRDSRWNVFRRAKFKLCKRLPRYFNSISVYKRF